MKMTTAQAFGGLIYETRKKTKLTQFQLAAVCGVGERFIRELEKGKPTCQLDKALKVAFMLGIDLQATLPFMDEE
jgi:HTH-type transcriptional regulator / antitoxin HipB